MDKAKIRKIELFGEIDTRNGKKMAIKKKKGRYFGETMEYIYAFFFSPWLLSEMLQNKYFFSHLEKALEKALN